VLMKPIWSFPKKLRDHALGIGIAYMVDPALDVASFGYPSSV
jgi:hypothetical protein